MLKPKLISDVTSLNLVLILISEEDGQNLVNLMSTRGSSVPELKIERVYNGECFVDSIPNRIWEAEAEAFGGVTIHSNLTTDICHAHCRGLGWFKFELAQFTSHS